MGHYDDCYEAKEERARVRRREALELALGHLVEAQKYIRIHGLGEYVYGQLHSVMDRVTLEIKT